ncbi:MAG: recombinase family protein [Ruminococcaceae bacterium]|nr:recombinase family protein [Oscillospiraceae bacterium]
MSVGKKNQRTSLTEEIGVPYARFSSHNQKEASIDQQLAACRQKAKDLGITLIDSYTDYAVSGKTDKRPSFQRMMRDAEKGKFKYVIAWKSNRIGRNMLEAMMNEAKLNSYGVRVIYVEEDFDDTAAGRFALRSMMNVNQFYSESMAEDIRRGMEDNALKCMVNGSIGYGYKKDTDGRFAIDEKKASVLAEIYQRVSDREPFVDIFTDLNNRGIPSPSGGKWNRSSFHRLLPPNERIRGIYIWGEHRVEGGIPRLISDELYYKVEEVLKTKKTSQGRHRESGDYLLTGKLFCGYCNSPMTGVSGTGKSGKLHYYYVCQKKRTAHECKKKNVRRDAIELAVAQAIKDYALRPESIEWIADSVTAYTKKLEEGERITFLQEKLSGIKKTIKNIMTAIEQGIFTDTTKERLLELEKEQAEVAKQINIEKSNIVSVSREDIIAGMSTFQDGDIHDKTYRIQLFDTFLIAVYLYDDEMKIVFTFSGKNKSISFPLDASVLNKDAQTNPENVFVLPPQRSTKMKAYQP